MNFRRSRYASGAPGTREERVPESPRLAPQRLRHGELDGWHPLPCGGALRFMSGEPIEVSNLGSSAPLKALVMQASEASGITIFAPESGVTIDGVTTWRLVKRGNNGKG